MNDPPPSKPTASANRQRGRAGEGHLLREDLIAAGCAVLADCGDTRRVSLRAVPAAGGVSPTAVYRHFPGRRASPRA